MQFLHALYQGNASEIEKYAMIVNCAHGKGIKFIRDEVKFFSGSQIDSQHGACFKSIVLLNADKLTQDAQSALRRCIEVHNHNTRFLVTIEDKNQLLKPILSRLCEIFIPRIPPPLEGRDFFPNHGRSPPNAAALTSNVEPPEDTIQFMIVHQNLMKKHMHRVKTLLSELFHESKRPFTSHVLIEAVDTLCENAFTSTNIISLLESSSFTTISTKRSIELALFLENIQHDIRSEWIVLFHALYYIYIDCANEQNLFHIFNICPTIKFPKSDSKIGLS
jgi:hypothetical protein